VSSERSWTLTFSSFIIKGVDGLKQITLFPETAESLAYSLREAELDHAAFYQKIKVCELEKCRGTCCHDGVYLSKEEAEGVSKLAERVRLLDGMDVPGDPIEQWPNGKLKTKTRPAEPDLLAIDYPDHFPQTRCIFLDKQHRCGLQRLALEEEEAPWYYKPLTCWIHPILIQNRGWNQRPLLTLPSVDSDPQRTAEYPGFSSCAHCGRADAEGEPAMVSLRAELEMLGEIGGRDLVSELS